jgi:sec-independent protein translocase protein TatC
MTLFEHLLELRNRLVISAIALAVTTAGAFVFYKKWMDIALRPIGQHDLQAITPTETIFTYFQVTLVVGLLLAMPVIAYEAWAYVAPGLTRKERRYVIAFIPGVTFCFVLGVAFAYFALLPAALGFLLGFGADRIKVVPTIESYVKFVSHLMIATGLIFEMPLVMFFLAKIRLVNAKLLGSVRRYVIVVAFIVAAVVTPTPDPFNQLLVAVPILVLYEVGVLLSRLA